MSPKVSVLLPTYNRIRWLKQAVDSVLAQSADLELLILDNGGSDGSWALLQKMAAQDPRIRLFRREQNCAADAYKFLLLEAKGDYATFFADDDEMLPEGLAPRAAVLDAHPEIGIVWSPVRIMGEDGTDQGEPPLWVRYSEDRIGGAADFDSLIVTNYIPMPATLFRLQVPSLVQGPIEEIGPVGDWNVWLSALRTMDAAYLRKPTVRLRFHGTQVTQQEGFKEHRFLKGHLAVWRYWMLDADPPYIPTPMVWRNMLLSQAQMAVASHGKDEGKIREELDRLVAIRMEQQKRLGTAPAKAEPPLREAFLFEPDWSGSTWVQVVLGYVHAFAPGEPVGLVIPLDASREDLPSLGDAQEALLQVIALAKRETFPDIIFLDQPGEGLESLRTFDRAQWVRPEAGPTLGLRGAFGTRLALAFAALDERPQP